MEGQSQQLPSVQASSSRKAGMICMSTIQNVSRCSNVKTGERVNIIIGVVVTTEHVQMKSVTQLGLQRLNQLLHFSRHFGRHFR